MGDERKKSALFGNFFDDENNIYPYYYVKPNWIDCPPSKSSPKIAKASAYNVKFNCMRLRPNDRKQLIDSITDAAGPKSDRPVH